MIVTNNMKVHNLLVLAKLDGIVVAAQKLITTGLINNARNKIKK